MSDRHYSAEKMLTMFPMLTEAMVEKLHGWDYDIDNLQKPCFVLYSTSSHGRSSWMVAGFDSEADVILWLESNLEKGMLGDTVRHVFVDGRYVSCFMRSCLLVRAELVREADSCNRIKLEKEVGRDIGETKPKTDIVLRDYLAGCVIVNVVRTNPADVAARYSYEVADAMLRAREAK